MIRVLRRGAEIEEATTFLQKKKLVMHYDNLKNWDLHLLYDIIAPLPRTIRVVDLGCAGLAALDFFYYLGFQDIVGIDLTVTRKERIHQAIIMLRSFSLKPPYHFNTGDITDTKFSDQSFDLATCISVIEHGVDPEKFLSEMNRIVNPEGCLFITTDYWPEKMKTKDDERPCGLPYNIFSKDEIFEFIALACEYDFSLCEPSDLPDPSEQNILGEMYDHTFICMAFRKGLG